MEWGKRSPRSSSSSRSNSSLSPHPSSSSSRSSSSSSSFWRRGRRTRRSCAVFLCFYSSRRPKYVPCKFGISSCSPCQEKARISLLVNSFSHRHLYHSRTFTVRDPRKTSCPRNPRPIYAIRNNPPPSHLPSTRSRHPASIRPGSIRAVLSAFHSRSRIPPRCILPT